MIACSGDAIEKPRVGGASDGTPDTTFTVSGAYKNRVLFPPRIAAKIVWLPEVAFVASRTRFVVTRPTAPAVVPGNGISASNV